MYEKEIVKRMEPVFTLPYSEYCVANQLQEHFKPKAGFSIFIPISRQEKGIDLLLMKRHGKNSSCLTIQVKLSRTYSPKPNVSGDIKGYKYHTWYRTFIVPDQADYFFLVGLYPPEKGQTMKKSASWWESVILVFNNLEMREFIANTLTRSGKPDPMFDFGFNNPNEIFQTRGDRYKKNKDYSDHLLMNQINNMKKRFR